MFKRSQELSAYYQQSIAQERKSHHSCTSVSLEGSKWQGALSSNSLIIWVQMNALRVDEVEAKLMEGVCNHKPKEKAALKLSTNKAARFTS